MIERIVKNRIVQIFITSMLIMCFLINDVIDSLKDKRMIFTSEADFQLALAQEIAMKYPKNAKVRLEYCPDKFPQMHIDILVLWTLEDESIKWIPIELKYKTQKFEYQDNDGCKYNLKEQSAYDCGCYDYLKDISRIETIKKTYSELYKTGFAIFLTNDTHYKTISKRESNYDNFRLYEERTINDTTLEWRDPIKISDARSENIHLKGNYVFNWKQYSALNENMSFEILINKI